MLPLPVFHKLSTDFLTIFDFHNFDSKVSDKIRANFLDLQYHHSNYKFHEFE